MLRLPAATVLALTLGTTSLGAQARDSMPSDHRHMPGMTHESQDTGFTALKQRGKKAMKVDQDQSLHRFDSLKDGGRIELQSTTNDAGAIAGIREHFKGIDAEFRRGDFSNPMFVHAGEVPGTSVMAAKKDRITYAGADLPRGAELRLRTSDPDAIEAIHAFLAFQRREHRAPGTR